MLTGLGIGQLRQLTDRQSKFFSLIHKSRALKSQCKRILGDITMHVVFSQRWRTIIFKVYLWKCVNLLPLQFVVCGIDLSALNVICNHCNNESHHWCKSLPDGLH